MVTLLAIPAADGDPTACEAMNGFYDAQADGSLVCAPSRRPVDAGAGPTDSGPRDAGAREDSGPRDIPGDGGCCNANPDPCCPMLCSGGVGPDASIYVACEQNWTQCESTNGDYEPQPDGSLGCTHADAHD